jgi:hypothetical protein
MSTDPNWLGWQQEHTDALHALQDAQRGYHRAVSGQAFATGSGASDTATKEALRTMDAARTHLDEVRARQPR